MADTSLSGKSIAYGLLAIVGTALVYLFVFSKGLDMVKEASQQRANNEVTINALQQKIKDLQSLKQQFAASPPQVNALAVAMPADPQYAEIVSMIETMAARAGLILDNIQPSTAIPDGLPVSITVRGGYGNALTFVELLEKNVRPMQVGPFSIAGGATDVSMTISVTAVYQVPAVEVEGGVTPPEGAS